MKLTIILFFLFNNSLSALPLESSNQDRKFDLRVGLIEFPPLSTVSENSECTGIGTETLHKIFAKTNYNLIIYCSSPSRVYRDFNTGSIDLTINVKTTDALTKNALYSDFPFATLTVSLYEKSNIKQNINKISSVRFYSYNNMRAELEEKGYHFIDSNNTKESIAVFIRENDYKLVSYAGPFEYYLEQIAEMREVTELKNTIKERVLVEADSYFTINKTNINAIEIKKIIDDYYSTKS